MKAIREKNARGNILNKESALGSGCLFIPHQVPMQSSPKDSFPSQMSEKFIWFPSASFEKKTLFEIIDLFLRP